MAELTSQIVTDAAFDLVDEQGITALTMRGLAGRLGVAPMSLYRHFSSKDELLDAVVAAGCQRVVLRVLDDPDWRLRIESLFESVHRGLTAHPNLAALLNDSRRLRPGTYDIAEIAIRALLDAGLSISEAAAAYRALLAYTIGQVTQSPEAQTDRRRREELAALVMLPATEFPTLAQAGAQFTDQRGPAEEYKLGLVLLLDGIETKLRTANRRADA
jgi:TetR/AcrR family tetracycline transcriptional repressor